MANYRVTLGTGFAWGESFTVEANNEQEALDIVADKVDNDGLTGLYCGYYDLYDCTEVGQTVDEYAEANGFVCCGNCGIYVQLLNIERC